MRFRVLIEIYIPHSDLGGLLRFAGSAVKVKCLFASGIKTILSEAKLHKHKREHLSVLVFGGVPFRLLHKTQCWLNFKTGTCSLL